MQVVTTLAATTRPRPARLIARAAGAIVAVLATACFSKPPRPLDQDASVVVAADSAVLPPTPRLINNAFYSNVTASSGMSQSGFQVDTGNKIVDGELVLFIASIDNGSTTLWPDPIAPGFTQLAQQFYGNDGETFVVAWKIADHEPASYTGTYGPGINSGAATISVIAVTGANRQAPINASSAVFDPGPGTSPTIGASSGVTTTVPDCTVVYASGADWQQSPGSNTFQPPAGFTELTAIGDHGDHSWDWTSQQVDFRTQPIAGPTGAISGSLTSSAAATAWTVVLAIAPS